MKDNAQFFKKWYLQLSKNDVRFGKKQTQNEVRFIEKTLNLKRGERVLDLACGDGRHFVELIKKYDMYGLDFSKEALSILKRRLGTKKPVNIIRGDMRDIPFQSYFDAIIMMSSSFGYFRDDTENIKVLKAIYTALKPGGQLLFDLKNQKVVIENTPTHQRLDEQGKTIFYKFSFNKRTSLSRMSITFVNKKTNKRYRTSFILKLYKHTTLIKMLRGVGFRTIKLYGSVIKPNQPFQEHTSTRIVLQAKK